MSRTRSFAIRLLGGAALLAVSLGAHAGEARGDVGQAARSQVPGQETPGSAQDPGTPAPAVLPADGVPAATSTPPVFPSAPLLPTATPEPEPITAAQYLEILLGEVNALRGQAGLGPLAFAPPIANEALDIYVYNLTWAFGAYGRCGSGDALGIGASWEYVAATGYAAVPLGELLVCPSSDAWTPQVVVLAWRNSPPLLGFILDPEADTLACGLYGPQRRGTAYQTLSCLTYRAG